MPCTLEGRTTVDLRLLEPGSGEPVFARAPDDDKGGGQPGTEHTAGWSLLRNRPIGALTS